MTTFRGLKGYRLRKQIHVQTVKLFVLLYRKRSDEFAEMEGELGLSYYISFLLLLIKLPQN